MNGPKFGVSRCRILTSTCMKTSFTSKVTFLCVCGVFIADACWVAGPLRRHISYFVCVAQGHGAKGQYLYDFTLEFLLPVKAQASEVLIPRPCSCSCPCLLTDFVGCVQVAYKSTQRQVNISVKKEQWGWWDRLTKQERKPLFLAPDFDRWIDESDVDLEIKKVSNELPQWKRNYYYNCFMYVFNHF